jgi:hypothetical protein
MSAGWPRISSESLGACEEPMAFLGAQPILPVTYPAGRFTAQRVEMYLRPFSVIFHTT